MKFNKLVRDRIPEKIIKNGEKPIIHVAKDDAEYEKMLHAKLEEEVNELLANESPDEIADVLEVLDAMAEYRGFSPEMVAEAKKLKAEKNGRFKKRIILDEVEDK